MKRLLLLIFSFSFESRVEHPNGYVLWAVDNQVGNSGETSNWRQFWKSCTERKVEVHEGKKINSSRAKSTGVSLESGELGRGDKILASGQPERQEGQGEVDSPVRWQSRSTEEKPQVSEKEATGALIPGGRLEDKRKLGRG